jgi:hypothetical protein
LLGVGVVVACVVLAGVELAVVDVVDLCLLSTRKPPAAKTTSATRATSPIWRVFSVAFMALLSAATEARASLKWGIRERGKGKREGAVSRALGAAVTRAD